MNNSNSVDRGGSKERQQTEKIESRKSNALKLQA